MNIKLDAFDKRKILTAMRFGFAFDYLQKMESNPQMFTKAILTQVVNRFEHLEWDEELFMFN